MANKRRTAYKKKKVLTKQEKQSKRQQDIYRQVQKDVQKVNQRLKSLSRHYKTGTWSTKNLVNRLDSRTIKAWNNESKRIKINENMSVTQLKAVQKAVQQFMVSKTSTRKGIKEISESTKESLLKTFDIEGSKITKEDVQDIYDVMGSNEFNDISAKVGSSELIAMLMDTKDYQMSENSFISTLSSIIDFSNDIDLKEKASRLYNKFM